MEKLLHQFNPHWENKINPKKYFERTIILKRLVEQLENKQEAQKIVDKMFDKGIFPYTLNEFSLNSGTFKKFIKRAIDSFWYLFRAEFPKISDHYILEKNYAYFQKYIPAQHDIRITVIGNRAFGFLRKNRKNDFRASGSGLIDYDYKKIPIEAVKIAHKISHDNC